MSGDESPRFEPRATQTRLPFRVAAFSLGALFVGFGVFQLLIAADRIAFGLAIFVILTGSQFTYSAFTGHWYFPRSWLTAAMVTPMPARFLMVEPVSFDVAEIEDVCRPDPHEHSVNPYAPPTDVPSTSVVLGVQTPVATPQSLTRQFLDGRPFIHYGVVFFLEAGDDTAIHAALPLSSPSELLISRNTKEAVRVLPEFLGTLPNVIPQISERNLVVRMISTYADLQNEVCDRVVVQEAMTRTNDGEPSPATEPALGPVFD